MYRWLAQAARVGWRGRGVGRDRGTGPVLRPREVALGRSILVEDYVGYLAGPPLVGEERLQFPGGAPDVEVGEADGDERAVPTPLVRVEFRRGLRPPSHVVEAQDLCGFAGQRLNVFGQAVAWRSHLFSGGSACEGSFDSRGPAAPVYADFFVFPTVVGRAGRRQGASSPQCRFPIVDTDGLEARFLTRGSRSAPPSRASGGPGTSRRSPPAADAAVRRGDL